MSHGAAVIHPQKADERRAQSCLPVEWRPSAPDLAARTEVHTSACPCLPQILDLGSWRKQPLRKARQRGFSFGR